VLRHGEAMVMEGAKKVPVAGFMASAIGDRVLPVNIQYSIPVHSFPSCEPRSIPRTLPGHPLTGLNVELLTLRGQRSDMVSSGILEVERRTLCVTFPTCHKKLCSIV